MYLITFEGVDGSGKSTQIEYLDSFIQNISGVSSCRTREPGGTSLGRDLRKIIMKHNDLDQKAELMLMLADRAQHVKEWRENCQGEENYFVLCDRYLDSTMAYQCGGGGLEVQFVKAMNDWVCGEFMPDLTFILDISYEESQKRLKERRDQKGGETTRFDTKGKLYFDRLRDAYKVIASANAHRVRVIDASKSEQEVWEEIHKHFMHFLWATRNIEPFIAEENSAGC